MLENSISVLVTGGLGFIGSHVVVLLLGRGYQVTVVDDLSNSSISMLDRIELVAGRRPEFIEADIADHGLVSSYFVGRQFSAIFHFAGLKSVSESFSKPVRYYKNNVSALANLLDVIVAESSTKIVFSSSATVYGSPQKLPVREDTPVAPTSVYGRSKLIAESILCDFQCAFPSVGVVILRYFNPVGAHPSGNLGEDFGGEPGNLMPHICKVALGKSEILKVYGDDYATTDGTGVRDYIHVMDLAQGHLAAYDYMCSNNPQGCNVFNLGYLKQLEP